MADTYEIRDKSEVKRLVARVTAANAYAIMEKGEAIPTGGGEFKLTSDLSFDHPMGIKVYFWAGYTLKKI